MFRFGVVFRLLFWNLQRSLREGFRYIALILKLHAGSPRVVYMSSSGSSHRLSSKHRTRPWALFSRLRVRSSSASSGPPSPRPPAAGSRSRLTTRWPGWPASSPTSVTGPPWPPSPHTSRWPDSRSPTRSPSATGRRAPGPGCPTCTWPAWRSPCRTWR